MLNLEVHIEKMRVPQVTTIKGKILGFFEFTEKSLRLPDILANRTN